MFVPGIIFFILQNKYEVAKDKILLPSDSSMYVAFSKEHMQNISFLFIYLSSVFMEC